MCRGAAAPMPSIDCHSSDTSSVSIDCLDALFTECKLDPEDLFCSTDLMRQKLPKELLLKSRGLKRECPEGRPLDEADVHESNCRLLGSVASLVARLHGSPLPAGSKGSMLWTRMNKMLEVASKKPELWPQGLPNFDTISRECSKAEIAIDLRSLEVVPCHGDLKPSNIFLLRNGVASLGGLLPQDVCRRAAEFRGIDVVLLDSKLSGPNYGAFEIMKLFRETGDTSEACMEHFVREYARGMGPEPSEECVGNMVEEIKLVECLTWLEEMCLLLVLPQFDPSQTKRWNSLAFDRWEKFEATKGELVGAQAWAACLAQLG